LYYFLFIRSQSQLEHHIGRFSPSESVLHLKQFNSCPSIMASYDPSEHGDMDIIFVGGGATACVTAGRLAKANPDFKILIIEGGRNNFNDPLITIPANYMKNLDPSAGTVAVCIDQLMT
jgi:hypothetical protein